MSDVGTRKLFENHRVAVWELVLQPGEKTGVHTHTRDYLFHILEGPPMEVFNAKGEFLFGGELKSGETHYLELRGDELISDFGRMPASHAVRNIGRTAYREILIELK